MKNSFDMTAVVRNDSGKLILRTGLCVFALALIVKLVGHDELAVGLFRGMVIGCLDMVIMYTGIKKSLPYVNDPERGVKLMKRYRYYRLASAGSIVCLMLKMGFSVDSAMVGFLLIHIFYVLNLIFVACQLDKREEREERSVKYGK